MRDTTLTSPEMYMERVATCFYMKYHVYWENITDPRSFIYFIIIYFIVIIIIIVIIILLLLLLLLLFYFIDHFFLESQACLRFELHVFFTYKPVTKVGVIFWPGEFETQTKYSGQFVLPRKWTIEKDWRNQWVNKPV